MLSIELKGVNSKLISNVPWEMAKEIIMLDKKASELVSNLATQGYVTITTKIMERKEYMEYAIASLMTMLHKTMKKRICL